MLKKLYRLRSWKLTVQDTVILRADCNVPSDQGTILDDTRLQILIPTLTAICNTGARVIILTHWGRPTAYDPFLSTQHLVPWFIKHGVAAQFIDSPLSLTNSTLPIQPVNMCENIRFLNTIESEKWIAALTKLGTYFVHDGFSVMHRNDLFNTLLPLLFPMEKRSLGIAAHAEIERLDNFITHIKKPTLGIFGGAKLDTKINTLQSIAKQYLDTIVLLPMLCVPFFKKQNLSVGESCKNAAPIPAVALFKQEMDAHGVHLVLPTDLLVTPDSTYRPPYSAVLPSDIHGQRVVTIGPKMLHSLLQQIDAAYTLIINGLPGFFEIPESLDPMNTLLTYISRSQKICLITGGDTYALVQKFGLTKMFPYYSLAGGAALDYCAGKELPGITSLHT